MKAECHVTERACRVLGDSWQQNRVRVEALTSDGSLRRFFRLIRQDSATALAVAPPLGEESYSLREAAAGWHIGRHLFACNVPVPALYGFDEQSGLLVCEDLGNMRLHDLVLRHGSGSEQVWVLYRQVIPELVKMQVQGRRQFKLS